MIINILIVFSFLLAGAEADSIRTETIDGKTYIIHQVEQKETLFSIARKYGVALIVVVETNPNAGSGLDVGSLVKVPYTPNKNRKTKDGIVHKVGQKETLYSISRQYGVTVDEIKSWNNLPTLSLTIGQELLIKNKISGQNNLTNRDSTSDKPIVNTHTVATSETMYAISRKYGITIQQIEDWNQMQSNDLKPGQIIFISEPVPPFSSNKDLKVPGNNESKTIELKPSIESKPTFTETKSNSNPIAVLESVVGTEEIKEGGMALLLDGTEGNRRYLAHHRSVKPGTIIRIKNNATRKEVFVRVVDNLPSTEATDVVLRISKSAFDKLGGDGKFLVEVTYFK